MLAGCLLGWAESVTLERKLERYGGGLYFDPGDWGGNPGWVLASTSQTLLDPSDKSSLYYSFFSGTFLHSRGNVTSADVQLVTLGRRIDLGQPVPWGLDVWAAPVLGSRKLGKEILGNGYGGAMAGIGVYFPILEDLDLEVAWHGASLFYRVDSPTAPDQTYHELVLEVIQRSNRQIRSLPW